MIVGKIKGARLINLQKPWRGLLARLEVEELIDRFAVVKGWGLEKIEEERKAAYANVLLTRQQYRQQAEREGIDIHGVGLRNLRIHDLRHSFASVGAASGLSLQMIGALLGHSQIATTQRYSHLVGDPLKQAAAEIGSRIKTAMDTHSRQSNVENVVPLRKS